MNLYPYFKTTTFSVNYSEIFALNMVKSPEYILKTKYCGFKILGITHLIHI